ncbi:serine hydrolase domain-containing protein [Streptomyces sp. NPDC001657]|uniref:serine hydrolase domain-containing protein n=1 Tax=Streptomyces sp. NPDC001657 TaxID=3154522 RepID=UPI003317DF59
MLAIRDALLPGGIGPIAPGYLATDVTRARNGSMSSGWSPRDADWSVGYNVLGRIVEVVTGKTWDEALKDLLLTPLGLTHTMTLPEEALPFRAAMGHLGEPGQDPAPAPQWDMMPCSAGPYGRVIATAGDLARLARMHLAGGVAEDGTRVLSRR